VICFSQGILNQIAFNISEPLLIVGDSKGVVHSVKLSPNLRKRTKEAEEALKENDMKWFTKLEISKLEDILAQVIPASTDKDDGF
jgi:dynein intermediate chain 1